MALDRAPEAFDDYQKLLEELPDYPGKPALYRKLLSLAQKLNKKEEAEKYEAAIRPPVQNQKAENGKQKTEGENPKPETTRQ